MDELTSLATEAGRGDRMALAAFVRRAQPEVWRLCRHLLGPDAADDATQDTFLRAIPALPGFRADATARTWLLGIARRVASDTIRGEQRRRRLPHPRAGRSADHSGGVVTGDLLAHVEPDRREAFVLTQVLGLSYAEAAEVAGVPVGTIRSRVARARAGLAGDVRAAERA